MRRVLMVAYHFPPLAGSSGIQRTLRFAQHLPASGWEPLVLTVDPRAYERVSHDLDGELAPGLYLRRAFALDAARHLSLFGRYPAFLARPDRWMSWRFDAVRVGARILREMRPDAIWSTYPIATAHVIAGRLQRSSGLPWVADFRDPMAQEGYPPDPTTWEMFRRIESDAMRCAARCVFVTPGAMRGYAHRYPEAAARLRVIENGYDEESFAGVEEQARALGPLHPGRLTVLHSGIVYPSERDPTQLFAALGRARRAAAVDAARLCVRFRAAVHEQTLHELARRHGVEDLVDIAPPLPYREALVEMARADALLVLQASNCNEQIPAKIYEYLRARRPVLALTDPAGDTAAALRAAGLSLLARLDDAEGIAALLAGFVAAPRGRADLTPAAAAVAGATRGARAAELAALLEEAVACRGDDARLRASAGAAARFCL